MEWPYFAGRRKRVRSVRRDAKVGPRRTGIWLFSRLSHSSADDHGDLQTIAGRTLPRRTSTLVPLPPGTVNKESSLLCAGRAVRPFRCHLGNGRIQGGVVGSPLQSLPFTPSRLPAPTGAEPRAPPPRQEALAAHGAGVRTNLIASLSAPPPITLYLQTTAHRTINSLGASAADRLAARPTALRGQ